MNSNNFLVRNVGNMPTFIPDGINPQRNPKLLPSVIGVSTVAVGAWAVVKFAVPAIMTIVSPVIAGIVSFFMVMFSLALVKPTWKWIKAIAHKVHRAAIKFNPEIEVENRLEKFDKMAEIYRNALAKMEAAKNNFATFASNAEEKAKNLQGKLEENKQKMEALMQEKAEAQAEVSRLKSSKPKTQKEREALMDAVDRLSQIEVKLNKLASQVTSDSNILKMNLDWTESNAAKANIFANWVSFLRVGSGLIENKKVELANWWKEIKTQMQAAEAGKDATDALRFVLCGENDQEYDFNIAAEYILGKIDENYSVTAQNMENLMRYVDGFDFNSDDAYKQLENLLTGIESGEIEMPFAREIASPAHELTSRQREKAGVLGDVFLLTK